MPRDRPLRILHIEDNPLDAELIQAGVKAQGFDVEWTVAGTTRELEAALQTPEIDIILSDYTMPSFDGLRALDMARSRLPDVPFIFVSGTIGEERAVEALLRGATDYVLKDRPARLGPAIHRALKDSALRTQRRLVEAELHRTYTELQRLLGASPTMIYSARPDASRQITFVSDNVRARLGYDPGDFTRDPGIWRDLVHPDDRAEAAAPLERVDVQGIRRYRLRRADGEYRWIEDQYNVVRDDQGQARELVGAWTDITHIQAMENEKALLQEQFNQAQKMEAVGVLAGGVAHDFNNILMVILSYSEFLLMKLPPDSKLRQEVQEIQKAGNRAADLAHQLLAFSRKQASSPQSIRPAQAIGSLSKMLARLLGADIEVKLDLSDDEGFILCDPTHLDQILINLVLNARDAMPQGGALTIGSRAEIDRRTGDCFCLWVTDTGTGITQENLARVFEPFFTTKPAGKGTGLGLAMVRGAVKQNGGRIDVQSEVGTGTTVRIRFARVLEAQFDTAVRVPVASARAENLCVLLVEDNEAVRTVTGRLLQGLGYEFVACDSAESALEAASTTDLHVDVLVTDVVMQGMSGPAMFRELRKLRPDLAVVFCTGYLSDPELVARGLEPTAPLVHKPFGREELARAIRAALSDRGDA